MRKTLMHTVAAAALLAPAIAHAEMKDTKADMSADAEIQAEVKSDEALRSPDTKVTEGAEAEVTAEEVGEAAEDTAEATANTVEDAAEATADAAEDAYEATSNWLADATDGIDEERAAELEANVAASDELAVESDNYIVMTANGLNARTLTGAPVFDASAEEIGTVEDVVVDAEGNVSHIIVSQGGVFGFGGKDVALPYNASTIAYDAEAQPRIKLNVSEETVANAEEFDAEQLGENAHLASNLLGTDITLAANAEGEADSADLYDVLMTKDGNIEHAILAYGGVAGVGSKYVAVPFSDIQQAQGAGGEYELAMSGDDIAAAPTFVYYRGEADPRTSVDADTEAGVEADGEVGLDADPLAQ